MEFFEASSVLLEVGDSMREGPKIFREYQH